jgi:hypothetical protein
MVIGGDISVKAVTCDDLGVGGTFRADEGRD